MLLIKDRTDRLDILIAEEDADTRHHLRDLLEQEGFHCAEAATGSEAVELARQHLPQCVLLDLPKPDQDGFGVARQLRADPRTRGAYIHCLTGLTDEAARTEAAQSGCNVSLTKPIDVPALMQVIHQELKHTTDWVHGLTKTEAEELLDWLETHGTAGELGLGDEGESFAVRCPGFRVEGDAREQILLASILRHYLLAEWNS